VRVSLHAADLHYGNGIVLHTASSGSVPHLRELYLRLDDGDIVAVGEVRANIAYLNGLSPDDVTTQAVAAIAAVDWTCDPVELLATLERWAAAYSAPVRTLIDGALHDLAANRAGVPLCSWLGGKGVAFAGHETNQTLFWSPFDVFLAQAQAYVDRGFRDLKVRVGAGDFAEDLRRIAALRQRFGIAVKIAADANGQWSWESALERLRALAPGRRCRRWRRPAPSRSCSTRALPRWRMSSGFAVCAAGFGPTSSW
jgi:L-alanine-DL-glutamate epimerase-like enolase superfamily enzyme